MATYFPALFANIQPTNLDTNRKISSKQLDGDRVVPLLQVTETLEATGILYNNQPQAGWRNWKRMGANIVAQHPTEAWYVVVDMPAIIEQQAKQLQRLEDIELNIVASLKDGARLSPVGNHYDNCLLHPNAIGTVVKFRYAVSNTTLSSICMFIHSIDMTAQKVVLKNAMNNESHLVVHSFLSFHEHMAFLDAQPLDFEAIQAYQIVKDGDHSCLQVHFDLRERPVCKRGCPPDAQQRYHNIKQALLNLHVEVSQDNFDTQLGYLNVPAPTEVFFHLCDARGWFAGPWFGPQTDIKVAQPFIPQNRKVLFRKDSPIQLALYQESNSATREPKVVTFQYAMLCSGKHSLTICVREQGKRQVALTADTLSELASQTRAWLSEHVELVYMPIGMTFYMRENDQVEHVTYHC